MTKNKDPQKTQQFILQPVNKSVYYAQHPVGQAILAPDWRRSVPNGFCCQCHIVRNFRAGVPELEKYTEILPHLTRTRTVP
jgi:hypothetical protein